MNTDTTKLLSLAMILASILFLGYLYRPNREEVPSSREEQIIDSEKSIEAKNNQKVGEKEINNQPKVTIQKEIESGKLLSVICTVSTDLSCSLYGIQDNGDEIIFPNDSEVYFEESESFFSWKFVDHSEEFKKIRKVKAISFSSGLVPVAESQMIDLYIE